MIHIYSGKIVFIIFNPNSINSNFLTMKRIYFLTAVSLFVLLTGCDSKPHKTASLTESAAIKSSQDSDYSKVITAKIFIKPDKIAEFTELFKGMTENTLKEPGCTGYQLYQNPYIPTQFLVLESYKNQAAIDSHFAAGYFKDFGDKIGELIAQPSQIRIIDVAGEVNR